MACAMASSLAPSLKLSPSSLSSMIKKTTSRTSLCFLHSAPTPNFFVSSSASVPTAISSSSFPGHRHTLGNVCTGARQRGVVVQMGLATEISDVPMVRTGQWIWTFQSSPISIHFKEYVQSSTSPRQTLLLLPTLSDVSTTDEWQAVAEGLLEKAGKETYRIVVVDWPGLGLSERPPINYTVDVLEQFLAEFVSAADGPLGSSPGPPVIIGGGHAATIAARALSKGLVEARAFAAVAPTWAGPLPIVFGRNPTMEFRYKLLRNTLRSPGVGWALYKYLVSSPKNIRLQYLTHVYANGDNVTPAVVENRTALTQRDGARYAPAAFLTGLLDPATSREEFLNIFASLDGKVPTLVISTIKGPRRSRAEMEALDGAKGVTKFRKLPGALLPQEEYPDSVTQELLAFL